MPEIADEVLDSEFEILTTIKEHGHLNAAPWPWNEESKVLFYNDAAFDDTGVRIWSTHYIGRPTNDYLW